VAVLQKNGRLAAELQFRSRMTFFQLNGSFEAKRQFRSRRQSSSRMVQKIAVLQQNGSLRAEF
jgi:hypothetical protein